MGTTEKNYFLPEEFDEINEEFHDYLNRIYDNRGNLHIIP
jgi:hypothetical protein